MEALISEKIIVEPEVVDNTNINGILVPVGMQIKSSKGTVKSISVPDDNTELTVKVGDRVMYERHRAVPVQINDKEYFLLKESDIILIFNN